MRRRALLSGSDTLSHASLARGAAWRQFAVVDAHTLINGSFNWTRHAVLANFENVVISSDPVVCRQFIGEFERLWGAFGSRKYT
jgi:hypothetical protein